MYIYLYHILIETFWKQHEAELTLCFVFQRSSSWLVVGFCYCVSCVANWAVKYSDVKLFLSLVMIITQHILLNYCKYLSKYISSTRIYQWNSLILIDWPLRLRVYLKFRHYNLDFNVTIVDFTCFFFYWFSQCFCFCFLRSGKSVKFRFN